jgi:hypothetical protein
MTIKDKPEKLVYFLIFLSVVLIYLFADSCFIKKVNGISNVFLSVLTAGYVFLTYWILKSTRQSIREQARPYIIASLPFENEQVWLSIRNIGNRPALDVKVTITPTLEILGSKPELWSPLLTQSFLAPDREVRNPIITGFASLEIDPKKKVFVIDVEYKSFDQTHYSHKPFTIDLNSYVFKKLVIKTTGLS